MKMPRPNATRTFVSIETNTDTMICPNSRGSPMRLAVSAMLTNQNTKVQKDETRNTHCHSFEGQTASLNRSGSWRKKRQNGRAGSQIFPDNSAAKIVPEKAMS
jgi:hypothetical protein